MPYLAIAEALVRSAQTHSNDQTDALERVEHVIQPGWIAILDFGSQYTHLVARELRELNVFTRVFDGEITLAELADVDGDLPAGVVLAGSPHSVDGENAPELDPAILDAGIPLFGICYGFQLLASTLGGTVQRATSSAGGEFGASRVSFTQRWLGVSGSQTVWMSHGDEVTNVPSGWTVAARTTTGAIAAASSADGTRAGVQFHPEVHHTTGGADLFAAWLDGTCGVARTWELGDVSQAILADIRAHAGDRHVLSFVSGGVDSTVATVLACEALGADRVHAVHVDNGLLRANESALVVGALRDAGMDVLHVDAAHEFYAALAGLTDPEAKRFAIGDQFIRVQERVARELGLPDDALLCQGTLYPDLVESGFGVGKRAATMISHHNVGTPLVRAKRDAGLVLEPLRQLYKDEVRRIGADLGIPQPLLDRQPFPGPGLALRIMGEVTQTKCELLRRIDNVLLDTADAIGVPSTDIWQLFSVLTGAKAVGVHGDARSYGEVIGLRACVSRDGMTADCYRFAWDDLLHISTRITEECREVSKVVYDISSKPPSNIEWE